jgi:hypothetical protein
MGEFAKTASNAKVPHVVEAGSIMNNIPITVPEGMEADVLKYLTLKR